MRWIGKNISDEIFFKHMCSISNNIITIELAEKDARILFRANNERLIL